MLTKAKSGLSRVSKIPRRFKLGIHTIVLCLPPFPALRIRPLAWDRISRSDPLDQPPPACFCYYYYFYYLSLDLCFVLCYYIYVQTKTRGKTMKAIKNTNLFIKYQKEEERQAQEVIKHYNNKLITTSEFISLIMEIGRKYKALKKHC